MKRILVPIDFSNSSRNALKYAVELSQFLDAKLALIHCYPTELFSRKYDFEEVPYAFGIKNKLRAFFKEISDDDISQVRFLAKEGSIARHIIELSEASLLIVISGNKTDSVLYRFFGKRSSTISSEAKCSVLLVPPTVNFQDWEAIWHIKRKENESLILASHLPILNINPLFIHEKTFHQKKFISSFWNMISSSWTKEEIDPAFELLIKEAKSEEKIDLLILVNHQKNTFQKFLDEAAKHILFKNEIVVLIIQNNNSVS